MARGELSLSLYHPSPGNISPSARMGLHQQHRPFSCHAAAFRVTCLMVCPVASRCACPLSWTLACPLPHRSGRPSLLRCCNSNRQGLGTQSCSTPWWPPPPHLPCPNSHEASRRGPRRGKQPYVLGHEVCAISRTFCYSIIRGVCVC